MVMTAAKAKQLGELIAAARYEKGVSLRTLEAELGIPRSWLSDVEQGLFTGPPSPDRLARVAEALEIEPSCVDRLTDGAVAEGLPGIRAYFRAKYDVTPEQAARIERYVKRMQIRP